MSVLWLKPPLRSFSSFSLAVESRVVGKKKATHERIQLLQVFREGGKGDRKLARYHFGTLVKKHSFLRGNDSMSF